MKRNKTLTQKTVWFRADGNSQTGLGHIYRCLALIEMVRDEAEIVFVIRKPTIEVENLIKAYCENIIILEEGDYQLEAIEFSKKITSDNIIVLDGYKFDTAYQKSIKKSGARIVCVDDIHAYHFVADAVINHAGGISTAQYDVEFYTQLYLGPLFSIVRSVFWEKPSIENRLLNNVLICLGGADPNNELIIVLKKSIEKEAYLNYQIVTGSAYKYEGDLLELISNNKNVMHYKNIDALTLRTIMQKSSIAICSPSTVSYEYLSVGGELYLHPIANNQKDIYNYFIQKGLAFPFEKFRINDEQQIQMAKKEQEKVFDGKSYQRLKKIILNEDNSSL
ncbi:MAG: UDP-2,4-diacetamido-2,4,6-trideoxy-beta-L-altropyranose hydrolase [Chitinophagaceae bacterium]|nr:UDP-2,4-diacetamido-2,4,6-trideoxy-beta-L-altropyranose hydrolase [Chitinophagaceae bacterium]